MSSSVFISHASEDVALASVFKEWVDKTFPSRCSAFVSSSLDSLPPGSLWYTSIQDELAKAQVLICLVGPRSKDRPWILFEAGAAWLKQIAVVPILHSGLQPGELGYPLTGLQLMRVVDPIFPKAFLQMISNECMLGGVPPVDFAAFGRSIESSINAQRGPREVVSMWNELLQLGRVEEAKLLVSATLTNDFVCNVYGSWEQLSERYKTLPKMNRIIESEIIDGDTAMVTYTNAYHDEMCSVKTWTDFVFHENGQWRLAPQFVVCEDISSKYRKYRSRPKSKVNSTSAEK
jgi:hypothetical protein